VEKGETEKRGQEHTILVPIQRDDHVVLSMMSMRLLEVKRAEKLLKHLLQALVDRPPPTCSQCQWSRSGSERPGVGHGEGVIAHHLFCDAHRFLRTGY
jgi:hypothetical protein